MKSDVKILYIFIRCFFSTNFLLFLYCTCDKMLTNKHIRQWLEQEYDSCTIQHENTSMPRDINVNDDISDSEKYNEEKEDSETGRSNYYLIKANNTKWQVKQQTRNIRTGPKI